MHIIGCLDVPDVGPAGPCRRRRCRLRRRPARRRSQPVHRVRVPTVQPAVVHDGGAQRRVAARLLRASSRASDASSRMRALDLVGLGDRAASSTGRAVRWTATASGDRARLGHRTGAAARRRADGQPRLVIHRRHSRTAHRAARAQDARSCLITHEPDVAGSRRAGGARSSTDNFGARSTRGSRHDVARHHSEPQAKPSAPIGFDPR